jgi:hypothetical protein
MNKTRRDWSSVYKCYKGKRDSLTAFFSLATAVFIIAISFYCTVYFVGMKYPTTEILDEREISRHIRHESSNSSALPTTSSASSSR